MRRVCGIACCLGAIAFGLAQDNRALRTYFSQHIGLTQQEIESIRSGTSFAKTLPPRSPSEVFVFGAVYVDAAPESYMKLLRNWDRLRGVSGFQSLGVFSSPPKLSDVNGFSFDKDDIDALKDCKPGDCDLQLPAEYIEDFKRSFDWSRPDAGEQVNRRLQETALVALRAYQEKGNSTLGIYNDKKTPVNVAAQFRSILSYSKALPEYLPKFHNYLLYYPRQKPSGASDAFYWAKVEFGLKPTLRVVHVMTMKDGHPSAPSYFIAEKQLYANHYFHTALDLTFCLADRDRPKGRGFHLIKVMGSEQSGLTGFKGSILRKVAVSKTVSSLKSSLEAIKTELEKNP